MNVIFMGSSEFSLAPFLSLVNSSQHEIKAVFTKAPQKKGRGLKLRENIIHQKALERSIPTYISHDLKDNQVVQLIDKIEAELIVVVSYDKRIPANILYCKKYGAINIHPSFLPKYRGASPIQQSILNHDKMTAVCIMQMDESLDTGKIIKLEECYINQNLNYVELSRELSIIGSRLLMDVMGNFTKFVPFSQSDQNVSYCKKIDKHSSKIDWDSENIRDIESKIRAFFPYIRFHLEFCNKKFQIIKSKIFLLTKHHSKPGTVFFDSKLSKNLLLYCIGGILELIIIKPDNSKELFSTDFVNGLKGKKNGLHCL